MGISFISLFVGNQKAGRVVCGPNERKDAFATTAGGGLDVNLTKYISIKPIQVEYVMSQFDSVSPGGSTKGFGQSPE